MKKWLKWSVLMAFLFLFPSLTIAAGPTDPYAPPGAQQNQDKAVTTSSSSQSAAQNFVPTGCKAAASQFEGCPTSYFILDYVGKDVSITDVGDTFKEALNQAFAFVINLVWNIYTMILVTVIYFYRFSFGLNIMNQLTQVMKGVLDKSETYIWGGLFAWFFVIAFIAVLVKFFQLRRNEGYMILFRNIVIVAFASYVFSQVPVLVQKTSEVTGTISDYVLAGFLSVTPDHPAGQNVTKTQIADKREQAVDRIADALWTELYYKPYLVLEFGTMENGQKYVNQFFSYGKDNEDKRIEWLTGYNKDKEQQENTAYVDYESGVAKVKGFEMVTAAGITKRFSYELFVLVMGIVFSALLVVFCWKLLKWFFIGIGRALFTAFPLLAAMWPDRSLRDVVDWLLWTCFAFFMRIFLAAVLGIALTIFMILRDLSVPVGTEFSWLITFLSQGALAIACFVAIWMVMKEVQSQLESLVGSGAREPGFQDAAGWFKTAGRFIANRFVGAAHVMKDGIKSTGQVAVAVSGHPELLRKNGLWRTIGEARSKARLQRKSEKQMEQMGFDPYSQKDRKNYWSAMKEIGKAAKASAVLSALPPLPQEEGYEFPELKATLSDGARKVFKEMNMAGYSPFNRADRNQYAETHPEAKQAIEEIEQWMKLPAEKKLASVPTIGYSLPPQKPDPYTPEAIMYQRLGYHRQQMVYNQVADRLIAKRKEAFRKEEEAYKSLHFYKRLFTPKPEYRHPTQKEINQAYLDYMKEKGGGKNRK